MAEGISASSCRRTPTDRELEARAADEPRHQPAPRVDAASPGATVYAVQVPRGASKQDRAGAPRPMALEDLSKAMDARREVLERSSDPQARAAAARDLGKLQSTWADGAR
ncbi:MAG: hypothetical protein JNL38_07495, partial [Myxococcales bacterium]|nr:hypothetical protein [Myxococcales bacterium]